jgi:hypothetical protein
MTDAIPVDPDLFNMIAGYFKARVMGQQEEVIYNNLVLVLARHQAAAAPTAAPAADAGA